MDGHIFSLGILAACVVVVFGCVVLMATGCLILAATLPPNHPTAARLRGLSGRSLSAAWRFACRLDNLVFMSILAIGTVLTVLYS